MGLDLEIHLRGDLTPQLIAEINKRLESISDDNCSDYPNRFALSEDGATAKFATLWRAWEPGYERGPWLRIASVLLVVMDFPGVDEVRYGNDCMDVLDVMTWKRFKRLCEHYRSPRWNQYYC